MLTSPVSDLRALLCRRPALIVHFSGVPKGIGCDINYPKDLAYALANPGEILCCSTIEAGDFNAFPFRSSGFVGVVLDPIDEASIVFVHHDDVGAPKTTVERKMWDRAESLESCERTFTRDGEFPYNEWLVGPSRAVGIFVAPAAQIQEPNRSYRNVNASDVIGDLGRHRIFSCMAGKFVELDENGAWAPLNMLSVYA